MVAYIPNNLTLECKPSYFDKYVYLINKLYITRFIDKTLNPESYVLLYSVYLLKMLGHYYKEILNTLVASQIAETDNLYIRNSKSKGYRLTAKYRDAKFKRVQITDKVILRNYENYKKEISTNYSDAVSFLESNLYKLNINERSARNYIETNITDFTSYTAYNLSVDMLANGSLFFNQDSTAGRVHSNVSNMPSVLRPYLNYNGLPLVEIDICNSQPFLLNILLDKYFTSNLPPDVMLYRELTSTGKFYEYLMQEFNTDLPRAEFKTACFAKIFYSMESEKYVYRERKDFGKLFPNVSSVISHYKTPDYKNLAISMQRAEADIIINNVVPELMKQNIYCLTIHDSVLVTPENADQTKQIIQDTFINKLGYSPKIKTK